jgi:hypothetical protein
MTMHDSHQENGGAIQVRLRGELFDSLKTGGVRSRKSHPVRKRCELSLSGRWPHGRARRCMIHTKPDAGAADPGAGGCEKLTGWKRPLNGTPPEKLQARRRYDASGDSGNSAGPSRPTKTVSSSAARLPALLVGEENDMRDSAIATSIALQHGADPEVIRRALCRDSQGNASGPLGAALDFVVKEGRAQ